MTREDKQRRRSAADYGGDEGDFDMDHDDLDQPPTEVKKVPENQIPDLTEEQLNEVFTKVISAGDPRAPKGRTKYDYETGEFKLETGISQMAVHFCMDGVMIEAEGDEARDQEKYIVILANKEKMLESTKGQSTEMDSGEYPSVALSGDVTLKNQFNFSERATQTFNNPMRQKDISTEPPPTSEYNSSVSQWDLYDTYLEDLERKREAASLAEKVKPAIGKKKHEDEDEVEVVNMAPAHASKGGDDTQIPPDLDDAMKLMERIVHTNSEAECFQDYKYYEDKSEHKREDGRGSFLPLWRFAFSKAHRKTCTAIVWNPQFTDLFAAGFGSYDFTLQGAGLICCYTLKNTSYPEYTFETESGVMSLDFHPVHSSLLCVGMYDGTVSVYDVKNKSGKPLYTVTDPKIKHTDPVWQVYWSKVTPEDPESEGTSFFSVSSDGRVVKWILSKTELLNEEVIELALIREDIPDQEDEASTLGLAGGCCFDFDKSHENLFVVGTEEGAIHSYSKEYNPQHLRSFQGHHMAVYACKWNAFHPDVFLSCSADWTVKLWERNTSRPIMTFDLNMAVGDVAWAPFSSTVFATITTDGKVRVYDLKINKHEPIGDTRVHKKAKLTHISFNPKEPIICVGDDRGVVTVLKLSSNLRKMSAPHMDDIHPEEEIAKLNKVMIMPDDDGLEDINTLLEKAKQAPPPPTLAITEEVKKE